MDLEEEITTGEEELGQDNPQITLDREPENSTVQDEEEQAETENSTVQDEEEQAEPENSTVQDEEVFHSAEEPLVEDTTDEDEELVIIEPPSTAPDPPRTLERDVDYDIIIPSRHSYLGKLTHC